MIVLISGGIATGKTTTAAALAELYGGRHLRVRHVLAEILGVDVNDRRAMQNEGAALDRRTSGTWLRDYLLHAETEQALLVVDSLRTVPQTVSLLESVGSSRLAHLQAHESIRRKRYLSADDPVKRALSFDDALSHPTERAADDLATLATVVVETDELAPRQIARVIAQAVRLEQPPSATGV